MSAQLNAPTFAIVKRPFIRGLLGMVVNSLAKNFDNQRKAFEKGNHGVAISLAGENAASPYAPRLTGMVIHLALRNLNKPL